MSNQIATKELIKVLFTKNENVMLKISSDECVEAYFSVKNDTLYVMDRKKQVIAHFSDLDWGGIATHIVTDMRDYDSFMFLEVLIDGVRVGRFIIDNGINNPSDENTMEEIIDHSDNAFCNQMYGIVNHIVEGA